MLIAVVLVSVFCAVLSLGAVGFMGWLNRSTLQAQPTPTETVASTTATPPPVPATVAARGNLSSSEQTTVSIFRNAAPSVVYITKLSVRRDPFRRNALAIPQGTGSGFIWDDQGHIVTNFHVIQGGDAAQVTLSDQSTYNATLVGVYPDKDIAVLKVEAPTGKLQPLPIGASEDLTVGQHVFAIGNPFGLDHTLSTGVVSGIGREIQSVTGRPIQGVIQTDAAINPGNSGGPLLDSAGRLIGVNTMIYSPSGASAGIGFAVPVDIVRVTVPQLIAHGKVQRPGLGIQIDEGNLARRAGVKGVLILGVIQGSGAEKAGLQPATQDSRTGRISLGDIIIAIDEQPTPTPTDLFRAVDAHNVGDTIQVTVRNTEGTRTLPIQLTALPD